MKKKYLIFIILIASCLNMFSQVQTTIIRQKTLGGNHNDSFWKAVQTNDGGYLIAVGSASPVSGDRTVERKGGNDIWLLKLSHDLSIEWQKSIGGSLSDTPRDIIAINDSSFLLLAHSSSPVSLDKTAENYGIYDYWLLKLDAAGNILWQRTYGGENNNMPGKIVKVTENHYLLAGSSDSDSSGVKTENSRGFYDIWVLLVDADGNIMKDKTIGGSGGEIFVDMIFSEQDSTILIFSKSNSPVSGDVTTTPFSLSWYFDDYLIFRLNYPDLSIAGEYRYGGDNNDAGMSLIMTDQHIYAGGSSQSDSSGVKSENSRGWADFWVLKLDNEGAIIWDKTIGGSDGDVLFQISLTHDKQLLLLGFSFSDISGEKSEPNIGTADYWIVSLDTNANILWQKTIGANKFNVASQVIALGTNHYILFGDSDSDISGHKTEHCRGLNDVWIVEISVDLSLDNFSQNKLHLTPNPVYDRFSFTTSQSSENGLLYIFDTTGKIVFSTRIENSENSVDVSFLKDGIYFVSFFDEKGKGYSGKIVKMQ